MLTTSHAPDHSRPPISPDSQTCQQTLDTSLISISFPFLFQLDFQFAGLLMDQFLCATHSAYKVFLFVRLSESVLLPSINSEPSVMWHIIFSDAAQIGNFLKRTANITLEKYTLCYFVRSSSLAGPPDRSGRPLCYNRDGHISLPVAGLLAAIGLFFFLLLLLCFQDLIQLFQGFLPNVDFSGYFQRVHLLSLSIITDCMHACK